MTLIEALVIPEHRRRINAIEDLLVSLDRGERKEPIFKECLDRAVAELERATGRSRSSSCSASRWFPAKLSGVSEPWGGGRVDFCGSSLSLPILFGRKPLFETLVHAQPSRPTASRTQSSRRPFWSQ